MCRLYKTYGGYLFGDLQMLAYHKLNFTSLWLKYTKEDWDRMMPIIVDKLDLKGLKPNAKVLDVGFGNGMFIDYIRERHQLDMYGTDKLGTLVNDYVSSRKEDPSKFIQSSLPDVPFLPNTFDRILVYGVLLYLSDEDQCKSLVNLVKSLKPGGKLVTGGNVVWNYQFLQNEKNIMACLANNNAKIRMYEERDLFGNLVDKYNPTKLYVIQKSL